MSPDLGCSLPNHHAFTPPEVLITQLATPTLPLASPRLSPQPSIFITTVHAPSLLAAATTSYAFITHTFIRQQLKHFASPHIHNVQQFCCCCFSTGVECEPVKVAADRIGITFCS